MPVLDTTWPATSRETIQRPILRRSYLSRDRINVEGERAGSLPRSSWQPQYFEHLYILVARICEIHLLKKYAGNRNLCHRDVAYIDLTRVFTFWDQPYEEDCHEGHVNISFHKRPHEIPTPQYGSQKRWKKRERKKDCRVLEPLPSTLPSFPAFDDAFYLPSFFPPGIHKYLSFAMAINCDNSKYFFDVLRASRPPTDLRSSFRGTWTRRLSNYCARLVASKHLLLMRSRSQSLNRQLSPKYFKCGVSRNVPVSAVTLYSRIRLKSILPK